jgi:hypothetical protein
MSSEKRFLVVTGMHRSHTSLLGSMIQRSGLPFHDDMVGADISNPHGHFEDVAILNIHKATLRDNRAKWFRGIDRPLDVSDARHQELAQVIAMRFATLGPRWGFKTPQSTLFLDMFARYPQARFLFIHRPPAPVLSSLLRRMGSQIYWRPDAPGRFARAYAVYNERIAAFTASHPERCHVVSSDRLMTDPDNVLKAASDKLGLGLDDIAAARALVRPETVSAPTNWLERILTRHLSGGRRVRRAHEAVRVLDAVAHGATAAS